MEILQTWASVAHGLWYARSAEFMQTDLMETLRWLRVVGDTIFAAGAVALGWFVLGPGRMRPGARRIDSAAGPLAALKGRGR